MTSVIRKSELGSQFKRAHVSSFLFKITDVWCFSMAYALSPRTSSESVCIQQLHAQFSHEGGPNSWETECKWSTGSHWLLPSSNNKSKYLFITLSPPWPPCLLQILAVQVTVMEFFYAYFSCLALKIFVLEGCSLVSSNNDVSEIIHFIVFLWMYPTDQRWPYFYI